MTAAAQRESWLALPESAAIVVLWNAMIAFGGDHDAMLRDLSFPERARLFLFLMTGPFGGWDRASGASHPSIVHLVVSAGVATLGVLFIHRFVRSGAAMILAAIAWVVAGYTVCIAVHI